MKLQEIIYANQVLKTVIDNADIEITPKLKFKLLGIMKEFEPIISNFEVIRNELISQYGTKDDDGHISINREDTESMKNFNNAIQPLIEEEVNVNYKKLSQEEVFTLPSDVLLALYSLIELED
jgi:hypothetical protein